MIKRPAPPSGYALWTSGERSGSARGFTLVELMIVIAIAAILATLAVPSFNEASLNAKLNTISTNFVASAQLARSEAIKRNATVTLCASTDGAGCGGDWSDGWVVLAAGQPIFTQAKLTNGFKLTGDATSIAFQPTGLGATPANLTACRATPSIGTSQRTVTVSATGRPSVGKVSGASSCP